MQDPTVLVAHCFVTNSPQELINLVHLALAQGAVPHGCDILLNLLHRLETRNGNDRAAPRPQPAKRALRERAPITRQDLTNRVELAQETWQTLAIEVIPRAFPNS